MKLRKALLVLSLAAGVVLTNPTAVFATNLDSEYQEDNTNDELTGGEIDNLDTVEDKHDVDDYGREQTRSTSGDNSTLNEGNDSNNTSTDGESDSDSGYDPWEDNSDSSEDNDKYTSDSDSEEPSEDSEEKVKSPKTGDNMVFNCIGLAGVLALGAYVVLRKEN